MTDPAAPQNESVTAAALALHGAGISVIPAAIDGTKAPMGKWRKYQKERMPAEQLRGWFDGGHTGLGIITGAISGNLEMLELEGRAVQEGILGELVRLASGAGIDDTLTSLLLGYLETTPSGGIHILYRVTDRPVPGNTKLAKRPARPDEYTDEEREALAGRPDAVFYRTLIETRGEGGFVVTAPSHGSTHATGKPWAVMAGGPSTIPSITSEQRHAIHTLCMTFDQTPHTEPAATARFSQPGQTSLPEGGTTPGDDYEHRTDWSHILTGWTVVGHRGHTRYWRRPGKKLGISATTGQATDRDRLYVFTTSTEFESETPYTKFGAYTLLHHGGDHSAAAKTLRGDGYGTPPPEQPRPTFSQPTQDSPTPDTAQTSADAGERTTPDEPSTYSATDDGNALRLIDTHAEGIRYCPERGSWLVWNGHRWCWDVEGQVQEFARTIARALPLAERTHRRSSLSARGLAAMTQVARTDPRIVAPIGRLDAHPYDLNTPAGLVDLRTGVLRPADPAALCARSTTVAPDFEARPERWLKFLAQTFAGDDEMATYVQRLIGVSLVGKVLEQLLPFPFGVGANGKSTLMGAIMRILGIGDDGYALSAPAELLLATTHNEHPTEIARLAGTRFVVTSELEDGQKFAEAKVKLLTGGDPVPGRFMRGDYFTFIPTHTIWMPGNHQPDVRTGGPAFWRRLRLLPFLHIIPEEEQEKGLESLLVDEEGPGILAWAIRGAADYFAHGNQQPESVRIATDQYQADQDSIGRFVEENCETGSPAAQLMCVPAPVIRADYEAWCHQEGESPISVKAFSMALQKRWNVIVQRDSKKRTYLGIRLSNPSLETNDPSPDERYGGQGW